MSVKKSTGLPMTVGNVGFMIDRLGQDCAPLQYIRELTQNSIEAILATPERTGGIVWDVDPVIFNDTGVEKLRIVDNGVGMTGPEMLEFINKAFNSNQVQGYDKNFGIGAKVAAATRNPAGLIYISWKEGNGAMIHLWRNPDTGEYEILQNKQPDGTYGHYTHVDSIIKPPEIGNHGTIVVLLGESEEHSTFQMPARSGLTHSSRWVNEYLSTRYMRIPEGITVKARDQAWYSKGGDRRYRQMGSVRSMSEALAPAALHNGVVALDDANLHWWILKEGANKSGGVHLGGHTAALYQDELYEHRRLNRGGAARLQSFGVYAGASRVVIYAEPLSGPDRRVISNTARTQLLVNNEPLPWSEWAGAFREKMPPEISTLVQTMLAKTQDADGETIKERLKALRDLYKPSRYRPNAGAAERMEPPTDAGTPRELGGTREKNGKKGGATGGLAGRVYSWFQADSGPAAERITSLSRAPEVNWITAQGPDPNREPGDLEDRAARYIPEGNVILANADFRIFYDMSHALQKRYGASVPGGSLTVKRVVRSEYAAALVEAVVVMQALSGDKHWPKEQVYEALSEAALTAVVAPRWHIYRAVEAKLRKMGAKAA